MNNYTYRAAAGRLLIGAVLLGAAGAAQAQADCGAGAGEGDLVTCDTTGLHSDASINIFAAENGVTTMTVNTRRDMNQAGAVMTGHGPGRIEVNVEAFAQQSRFNFSANSGGVDFVIAPHDGSEPELGGWELVGDNVMGADDDRLHIAPGALFITSGVGSAASISDRTAVTQARIDFGDGDDRFENAGVLMVGDASYGRSVTRNAEGDITRISHNSFDYPRGHVLTLENLETFENAGRIVMGGWRNATVNRPGAEFVDLLCTYDPGHRGRVDTPCGDWYTETDLVTATVLDMRGTHFIGAPGSTLVVDVSMGTGSPQYDCLQRVSGGSTTNLPSADCVDLRDGETSGSTAVVVRDRLPGDLGAYNPDGIVIIDVGHGESAAEHFFLSPDSDGYDPVTRTIDKGLFMFPLVYDEARQQHKLISLAGQRAYRLPLMVQAVQALSRSTGRQWFERRADLRAAGVDQADGAWVRLSGESASRDGRQTVSAYGNDYGFDNSYDIDSTVLSIGRDFALGDAWVVGASASYISASADFTQAPVSADFDGAAVSLHASWMHESLYLDSQLQMAWLEMNYEDPRFKVATSQFNTLDSATQTLDLRAELGYRLELTDGLRLEPMLGVSWVRSEFSSMTLYASDPAGRPTNEVFGGDAPASLRVSLGGRLSYGHPVGELRLDYVLLARYWEELRGETAVRIRSAGPDTRVRDTFDSGLGEVGAGISLSNASGLVSGLLQANAMFGDYESLGVTAGLQVRW